MKKYLFIICFLLSEFYSFSQMDTVYAKIEITSFFLNEQPSFVDTSIVDTSIVVTLEKFGRTSIIKLGVIDTTGVGFQLELLKSHLGEKEIMLNGIALFTYKNGKWEMYANPTYQFSNYKTISDKSLISEKDVVHASLAIQGLQVDYKQLYYVIK
jgi:hypothetical protein